MEPELKAFSERRKEFENDTDLLQKIVTEGKEKARASAAKTLATVKKIMRITK